MHLIAFTFSVLGIFIEEGKEHPEFAKMMPALTKALRKGQTVKIDATIDPAKFLPGGS
jgi:carbonic anhydrase